MLRSLVQESGDEKDVVDTGKKGQGEDGGIDGGEIVAGADAGLGGKHDHGDGHDLDDGADLSQQRGPERAKTVTMLIAAAPTRIKTSRLMTVIVTQKGTGKWLGMGVG